MKYCKNCGSELPDDAAFCAKCGTPASAAEQPVQSVQPTQTVQQTPPPVQPMQTVQQTPPPVQPQAAQSQGYYAAPVYQKTNTMSVVGFVLSLLGFNLVSLILSIVGLSQVKKSQMTQMPEGGRGLAIAGIIISSLTIVAIVIYVILAAIYASAYYYYY